MGQLLRTRYSQDPTDTETPYRSEDHFVVASHTITQNLPIGNRTWEEIYLLLDWFQVRWMHDMVCTKEGLWIPPCFKMCTENGKENTKNSCALLSSLPCTPPRKIPKLRCCEGGIQAGNRCSLICQLFNLLLFGTATCSASLCVSLKSDRDGGKGDVVA